MINLTDSTVDYVSNAFWVKQWHQARSDAPDMEVGDAPQGPNAYF